MARITAVFKENTVMATKEIKLPFMEGYFGFHFM